MKAIYTTILLLGSAWPVAAQDTKQDTKKDEGTAKVEHKDVHYLHRAKDVIGAKIRTADNAEAAEIKDLLVDSRTGELKYAVIDPEGALERDDQLLAIPVGVLQPAHETDDPDDCFFMVKMDIERLRSAPAFNEDKWPDLKTTAWAKPIDEYYARDVRIRDQVRIENASAGTEASYCLRATELRGLDLKTMGGDGAGEIEELAIDPQMNRVAYAVVATGGFLGLGEKHLALPWQALNFVIEDGDLHGRLNVPEGKLKQAPEFKSDEWKNMRNRVWLKEVYTYYGYPIYWTDEPLGS